MVVLLLGLWLLLGCDNYVDPFGGEGHAVRLEIGQNLILDHDVQ